MLTMMLLAPLVAVATPFTSCDVPPAAYRAAQELQATGDYHDNRELVTLAFCACGPEGSTGLRLQLDPLGQLVALPRCNRVGWDGVRYVVPR